MKKINYTAVFLVLFAVSACQDVIDLDVPEGKTRLVVDGLLTDRDELQTVKLKYTAPYFSNAPTPPISDALVFITDNTGAEIILEETAPGIYQKQFAGEVGKTYLLTVETSDGKVYKSLEEPLRPVSLIDSIYYEFEEESIFYEEEGYYVTISATDPEGKNNFYRWRYFVNEEKQSEPEDLFFISDEVLDGLSGLTVTFSRDALLPGDTARVEQMSLSENAYNFLFLLYQQTANVGSQFDPPPAPIKGNVYNTTDSNDYALGYFMATSITTAEVVIKEK